MNKEPRTDLFDESDYYEEEENDFDEDDIKFILHQKMAKINKLLNLYVGQWISHRVIIDKLMEEILED